MSVICKKTIDNNFIVDKTYELVDGYLYTENDISFNKSPYKTEGELVEDLKKYGYEFFIIGECHSSAFGDNFDSNHPYSDMLNGFFDFGFNSFKSNGYKTDTETKRKEAEDLKNSILADILNMK